MQDDIQESTKRTLAPEHYYGDSVRKLMLLGGIIMIFAYPFFQAYTGVPLALSILFALAIVCLAGLQHPTHAWIAVLNTLASTVAFVAFEYKAVTFYLSPFFNEAPLFFWVNQLLSLIFLLAVYYSTKTARSQLLQK